MESILNEFVGKNIDVNCGSTVAYRGKVVSVADGILKIVNEEEQVVYIVVDRIAVVSECRDLGSRPGFIS